MIDVRPRVPQAEYSRIARKRYAPVQDEFRRVVNSLPGLVWTSLPDGYVDFLNQGWCDYTGQSLEEACGWGWNGAISPEDLPRLLDYWRSILASDEPGEFGTLSGVEGLMSAWREWLEPWESYRYVVEDYLDAGGGTVVVLAHVRLQRRGAACALGGRNHLFDIFQNFLALMGYWVGIFLSIALEEQVLFRAARSKRVLSSEREAGEFDDGYDWDVWNDWRAVPVGLAALTAFLLSLMCGNWVIRRLISLKLGQPIRTKEVQILGKVIGLMRSM